MLRPASQARPLLQPPADVGPEVDDDDSDGDSEEEPVEPEPGPDNEIELPDWAQRVEVYDWEKPKSKPEVDWDAFDRARKQWEREITPKPVTPEPERTPQRELVPAGV